MKRVIFKGDEKIGTLHSIHESNDKAMIFFQILESDDHMKDDFWTTLTKEEWHSDNWHIDYLA